MLKETIDDEGKDDMNGKGSLFVIYLGIMS
jgi:hypothetical protein